MSGRHPLRGESWLARHIRARPWLRILFPAFVRRAWMGARAPLLLLGALAAALSTYHLARVAAPPEQPPLSLPALGPAPDLTPHPELPPGESVAPAELRFGA